MVSRFGYGKIVLDLALALALALALLVGSVLSAQCAKIIKAARLNFVLPLRERGAAEARWRSKGLPDYLEHKRQKPERPNTWAADGD